MKVLVTGCAGFIGRTLVNVLNRSGWTVAGLDRVPARTALAQEYICDLLDAPRLTASLRECSPDAMIHLAARTDLNEKNNLKAYAANIDGVKNLIAAVDATPSINRAIWTSSQLVCKVGYVPQNEMEYCPDTLYGESKVLTERLVREHDGARREWCLVRPTTVWGPGMSAHYRRFLLMIETGYYFHVGRTPLRKSYAYVGNIALQYQRLLQADSAAIHRKTFYLADYEPIDLLAWCDAFQRSFHSQPLRHMPRGLARSLAAFGDAANAVGFRNVPFNSFRLNNILTEYQFDLAPTRAVCGDLPYTMDEGVVETVQWFHRSDR